MAAIYPVVDIETELKGRLHLGKATDDSDEDEDPRGGQRVQCAQQ